MTDNKKRDETYAQKTKRQMVIGFFVILFTLGLALIWIFYGKNGALLGLLCLLGTLLPIGAIILILNIVEKLVKRN